MTALAHPKVIFIVGATAVGKSAFAMDVARRFSAEIINCDSVQMYAGVKIGAAKPTEQEQSLVRHHLLGIVPPPQSITAGDFRRYFFEALQDCSERNIRTVLAVGGSGFYIQAVQTGMFEVSKVAPSIQNEVEDLLHTQGLSVLFQRLLAMDPIYAQKIGPHDKYRIQRGLELVLNEKKTMAEIQEEFNKRPREEFPYPILKMGFEIDRAVLRERVGLRLNKMLQEGFIDEVRNLRAQNLADWWPMQSVGYQEVQDFLDKKIDEAEMREQIVIHTMQLAKRQMTWFKRDKSILWFHSQNQYAQAMAQVEDFLGIPDVE